MIMVPDAYGSFATRARQIVTRSIPPPVGEPITFSNKYA
jgi:hypothetical protein